MIPTDLTHESTSRKARAGEISLHYHEAGRGEVVIAIHGSGPGTTAWNSFSPKFLSRKQH